jgi:hypothetical protein
LINFWQSVFNHDSSLGDIAKKFAQHELSQEDLKDIDDFVISKITDNLKIHIKVRKAIQEYLYIHFDQAKLSSYYFGRKSLKDDELGELLKLC